MYQQHILYLITEKYKESHFEINTLVKYHAICLCLFTTYSATNHYLNIWHYMASCLYLYDSSFIKFDIKKCRFAKLVVAWSSVGSVILRTN